MLFIVTHIKAKGAVVLWKVSPILKYEPTAVCAIKQEIKECFTSYKAL